MTPFSRAAGLVSFRFGNTVGYYFQRCPALSAESRTSTDGCFAGRTKQLKLTSALFAEGGIGRVFAPAIRAPHRLTRRNPKNSTERAVCSTERRVETTSGPPMP